MPCRAGCYTASRRRRRIESPYDRSSVGLCSPALRFSATCWPQLQPQHAAQPASRIERQPALAVDAPGHNPPVHVGVRRVLAWVWASRLLPCETHLQGVTLPECCVAKCVSGVIHRTERAPALRCVLRCNAIIHYLGSFAARRFRNHCQPRFALASWAGNWLRYKLWWRSMTRPACGTMPSKGRATRLRARQGRSV